MSDRGEFSLPQQMSSGGVRTAGALRILKFQAWFPVPLVKVVPTACPWCNTKVGAMTQTSTRIVAVLKTPPGRSALFKVITGRPITTVNPKG
jgi:hypothetical protein